jgi:hypothetical protein
VSVSPVKAVWSILRREVMLLKQFLWVSVAKAESDYVLYLFPPVMEEGKAEQK